MKLTQRTMRCPLDECSAIVTVRTDPKVIRLVGIATS